MELFAEYYITQCLDLHVWCMKKQRFGGTGFEVTCSIRNRTHRFGGTGFEVTFNIRNRTHRFGGTGFEVTSSIRNRTYRFGATGLEVTSSIRNRTYRFGGTGFEVTSGIRNNALFPRNRVRSYVQNSKQNTALRSSRGQSLFRKFAMGCTSD